MERRNSSFDRKARRIEEGISTKKGKRMYVWEEAGSSVSVSEKKEAFERPDNPAKRKNIPIRGGEKGRCRIRGTRRQKKIIPPKGGGGGGKQ